MKVALYKWLALTTFLLLGMMAILPLPAAANNHDTDLEPLGTWKVKWENEKDALTRGGDLDQLVHDSSWQPLTGWKVLPPKPENANVLWAEAVLPSSLKQDSGIYAEKIYARDLDVYVNGKLRYSTHRDHLFDVHQVLLPLSSEDFGSLLLIRMENGNNRFGLERDMVVGNVNDLIVRLVKQDLSDLVLSSAFIFVALIMLICCLFLRTKQMTAWVSLSLVILAIGLLIITYSPFPFMVFEAGGRIFYIIFDMSLLIMLPMLTYFFESIFGEGKFGLIRRLRKFQMFYSALCMIMLVFNEVTAYAYNYVYYFLTVTIAGFIMIVQFLLLTGFTIGYTRKGDREALIFACGFLLFALVAVGELIYFYQHESTYRLALWKWGVLGFVISLIMILGRRIAADHHSILQYSKKLEMYNNRLQRSEKMQIISELAASVAHEVRNPLQVTRGFLQILMKKMTHKDKEYLVLAIEELDRASNIITDFLTFAKPQMEHFTLIDIQLELMQIHGMIAPMAHIQGGDIQLEIQEALYMQGNSSKFKQAFINIIKNSIEALQGDGRILIWAYQEEEEVVIHVKDNGEGMDQEELARLGEPYFSTKTKGTGLGLMVTYRIIEAMGGRIEFRSQKGHGTEAIVRFPVSPAIPQRASSPIE